MRRTMTSAILLSFLAAFCGAAAAQTSGEAARAPDNNPPADWPRPIVVLAPFPMQQDGGETIWSWVPGAGMLQATRRVTTGIGTSLEAVGERNRAVEACRNAAWTEAARLGARDIEAVPAGEARRDRWGRIVAPVRMRLTYLGLMWEVREAVMTCTVDRKGQVVEARM